jgi:hypothetical protein
VLESGAEGAILVLPEYGRVIGTWPHWRGENALWVNPDFTRMLMIGAKDDGWLNPGGDHIWLGPQEEFLPNDTVSPCVDPGKYEGVADKGIYSMENRGQVHAWKSGMMVGFRIQRRIRSLPEQEISDLWRTRWLRQAGYVEETTLEVSKEVPPDVWLWNLTQVPRSAEIAVRRSPEGQPSGHCRYICVDERDDGRAHLLVKEQETDAAVGDSLARYPAASSKEKGVISCLSASTDLRSRRRVVLRTALCAFSGRTAEIRAAAAMIGARETSR